MIHSFVPQHLRDAVDRKSPEENRDFHCLACSNSTHWLGIDDLGQRWSGNQPPETVVLSQPFETYRDGYVVFYRKVHGGGDYYTTRGYTRIVCAVCFRPLWVDVRCPVAIGNAARDLLAHERYVGALSPFEVGELLLAALTTAYADAAWLIEQTIEKAKSIEIPVSLLSRFMCHENAGLRHAFVTHLFLLRPFLHVPARPSRMKTSPFS